MSNGFRHRRATTPRRAKGWGEGPGKAAAQTVLTTSTIDLIDLGTQFLVDGLTLLRLRGTYTANVSAASAANSGFAGSFGIGLTDLKAFNVGVTALPSPTADADWDGWLFWEAWSMKVLTSTITDAINAPAINLRIPVDTKAMRKLRTDDVLFAMVEVLEVSDSTMNHHFDSRILLALP